MQEIKISDSTNIHDYEILIRKRGENQYASYCPQLNKMLLGNVHEKVREEMYIEITNHIEDLKKVS